MNKSHCCNDDMIKICNEENQSSFYHMCVSCEKPCFFQEDLADGEYKQITKTQIRAIAREDIRSGDAVYLTYDEGGYGYIYRLSPENSH